MIRATIFLLIIIQCVCVKAQTSLSIVGTLLDEYSGDPIKKAQIRLSQFIDVSTMSDDNGVFILLIRKDVHEALKDSIRIEIHHEQYHAYKAIMLKLIAKPANKERENVEFFLTPKLPIIIRGRVTYKGNPIKYIEISIYSTFFIHNVPKKEVITDENGRFQITIRNKVDIDFPSNLKDYDFIMDFIDPRKQFPNKTNFHYMWRNLERENRYIEIDLSEQQH